MLLRNITLSVILGVRRILDHCCYPFFCLLVQTGICKKFRWQEKIGIALYFQGLCYPFHGVASPTAVMLNAADRRVIQFWLAILAELSLGPAHFVAKIKDIHPWGFRLVIRVCAASFHVCSVRHTKRDHNSVNCTICLSLCCVYNNITRALVW